MVRGAPRPGLNIRPVNPSVRPNVRPGSIRPGQIRPGFRPQMRPNAPNGQVRPNLVRPPGGIRPNVANVRPANGARPTPNINGAGTGQGPRLNGVPVRTPAPNFAKLPTTPLDKEELEGAKVTGNPLPSFNNTWGGSQAKPDEKKF